MIVHMKDIKKHYNKRQIPIGPVGQKILLLLFAGITLAFTKKPDVALRILKTIPKAWRDINRNALQKSVRRLHQSGFVCARKGSGGATLLTLTEIGKKRAASYQLSTINIVKPPQWDGLWRVVMFDVPEQHKKGRDALAKKLKELGFMPIQKSVFVLPYECRNEISYIVEVYELSSYVKFLVVKELDGAPQLQRHFNVHI